MPEQAGGRLRVLVLASTFPRWQTDTEPPFVYNLSSRLAEDFDVTVLAPHAPGAATQEQMDGCEVVRFRYAWPERLQKLAYGGMLPNLKRNRWLWLEVPAFLAAELFATLRLIRSRKPDVVQAHWVVPQGIVAALAGLLTRKPVVITAHGGDVYGVRGGIKDALKRWALRRAEAVSAVSDDLRDAIERLAPGRQVEVISMGVDTTQFHPERRNEALRVELAGEGAVVLFVGRLAEKKGVRYLIEAMPRVLERLPGVRLLIIGDGPLRKELEGVVDALQLQANITFAGAMRPDELPAYYASADLFVGPSIVAEGGDTESFGLVFAEAMASRCAVIASDVGGVHDLVQDGETGVLVPQQDPPAIADAICRLLEDAELRHRLAFKAMRSVRGQFDQKSIAARYAALLEAAAGREPEARALAAPQEVAA